MPTPRISILLPARNAAATLPACLRSIVRQDERNWECIVVDDGSEDDTREVAASFSRRDPRFRILPTAHRGLVGALDLGLLACRAPLVARMDADDLMHRERLSRQASALDASPDLAGVGCHVRIFPRTGLTARLREYESWLNGLRSAEDVARDAFVECPVAHPSLMMRTSLAALGYDDRGWPEDYDLVLRALASGLRIGIVPRRLLAWRDRPDRLSRTAPTYALDRFTACKAYYLTRGLLGGGPEYILWGYGATGRGLARALHAHGRRPAFIVEIKPGRLGQRIAGAPVIAPDALAAHRGYPIVVSVARSGPRAQIRQALAAMGFVELRDFVCAA